MKAVKKEQSTRNLSKFIEGAWNVVEPGTPYRENWHIGYICEHLQAITDGQLLRLLVMCPPRYTKSRVITVSWPAWEWIQIPSMRWLFSSYAIDLARQHSRERRDIIQSDWYQENWGGIYQLRADQNLVTNQGNSEGGVMQCRGTGGLGTGTGGNRIVVDDPHNVKQAESDVQRESAVTDFRKNLSTRLNDPKTGAIVVTMQRLNSRDVAGHILSEGGYEVIQLSASPPKDRKIFIFPRSGKEYIREKDEVLWEERHDKAGIARQKQAMGSYAFSAQYDQNPVPEGGNKIKMAWFPRFRALLEGPDETVFSIDTGNKPGIKNDPSVIEIYQRRKTTWLLSHIWKERAIYPDLKRMVILLAKHWKPDTVIIEDKASGQSLIQDLQEETTLPVIGIIPTTDKPSRFDVQIGHIEAGVIALPDENYIDAPWLTDLEMYLSQYPTPDSWDELDAMSQFLLWLKGGRKDVEIEIPVSIAGQSAWRGR